MTDDEIGERLEFLLVRVGTSQWEVHYRPEDDDLPAVQVARVTERVVATPPYVVCLVTDGEDIRGGDSEHEDRDGAFAAIVAHVRATLGVA